MAKNLLLKHVCHNCSECSLNESDSKIPFFVQTNKRTERFVTKEAAELFMETHCRPWRKDNNAERVIKTNVIS